MQPIEHSGWYIETNGKFFRPYRKVTRYKGFWKWRQVCERDYIWTYAGEGYDCSCVKPKEFNTIDEARAGIDDEICDKHIRHEWELVCNP